MKSKEILERLVALLEAEEGEKTVGSTGVGGLFASGGMWAFTGAEPDVISAAIRPKGILTELSKIPSQLEQPHFATVTGFTGESGSEPAYPCSDAPVGYMKGCTLTAVFGRIARSSNTIDFDKVMLQLHRGVTTDLVLRGRLLGLEDFNPQGLSESDALNIVTMSEMVTIGANLERKQSIMAWRGSPANNNVGGGYKEFPGLDNQIATGQVDAETNQACPALDSDVKSFNYNLVSGTNPSIVEYLSMLEFYLRYNADRMGLDPVEYLFAMRPELWFELTGIWPCQYNTNRCASSVIGSSNVILAGNEMVAERDRMRRGMTIDVNGTSYRVITDTGIFEHNNANNGNLIPGQYASSIYMIPLRIVGALPATYLEHVDYRGGARDLALLKGHETFWTDRGQYSWAVEFKKWCYELTCKTEPRIILRTPQLAGRIDAVKYEPLQHLREPYADSPYFKDGGISIRPAPRTYAVWGSR